MYWLEFWWLFPIALGICVLVCSVGVEGALLFVPFYAVVFPWLAGVELVPLQAIQIGIFTEIAKPRPRAWPRGTLAQGPAPAPPLKLLRFSVVRERTGLSRSTIWGLERWRAFPKHRRTSANAVVWLESEIVEWIQGKTLAG